MGSKGKHGYSGVPPTDTRYVASASAVVAPSDGDSSSSGSHDAAALPVATAVSVQQAQQHDGPSTIQPPSAKEKGGANEKGGPNLHDGDYDQHDGGGIQITWDKGEVQEPAFRDRWFAMAFLVHLAAVLGAAVVLGPAGWSYLLQQEQGQGQAQDGSGRDDDGGGAGNGDGSGGYYDGNDTSTTAAAAVPSAEFWIAVASVATVAAPALSLLALGVLSRNAAALLRLALWFSVVLCGTAALIFLPLAPPAGLLYAIMTACLVCYARTVRHRIPFAASNLTCAIRVVRANLGIALVALGVLGALVAFACGWALAFAGTMSLDAVREPMSGEYGGSSPGTSSSTGTGAGPGEDQLNGLGGALVLLFLLSFYWTHQVLQNTLRSSVAGVVGTWWFQPLEASSFCSPAVRDSVLRSATYSLGSIAFGSLVVAILQLLRSVLRSAANDRNNRSAGLLHCLAACLLLYLERIVEYFNKWAYVYVGLYGYDYVTAGRRVAGLFRTRGWTAIIADNLVNRLLGIVCLTVGLLTGGAALLAALLVEELESTGGWLGAGFT